MPSFFFCSFGFSHKAELSLLAHFLIYVLPLPVDSVTLPLLWGCNLLRCYATLCLVTQLCPTLCDPMDCSPPGSPLHGDSPGKTTGVGCHALLQWIFPTQGLNPDLLHCRWLFTIWATKNTEPKNTAVGRLSLLQGILPTQESNWDLPCIIGRFLYQLSCQRSPSCFLIQDFKSQASGS